MKLKRILASVLTAAMVVTSVPVAGLGGIVAQAEETSSVEIGGKTYNLTEITEGLTGSTDAGTYGDEVVANALTADDKIWSSAANGPFQKKYTDNFIYLKLPQASTIKKVTYVSGLEEGQIPDSNAGTGTGSVKKANVYVSKSTAADKTALKADRDNWIKPHTKTAWDFNFDKTVHEGTVEFSNAIDGVTWVIIEATDIVEGGVVTISGKEIFVKTGDDENIAGMTADGDADISEGRPYALLVDLKTDADSEAAPTKFETAWKSGSNTIDRYSPTGYKELVANNNYYITLANAAKLGRLVYAPRLGSQTNGILMDANIYVSNDTNAASAEAVEDWKKVAAITGGASNDHTEKILNFSEVAEAKYVRIEATKTPDGTISAKQFKLYAAEMEEPTPVETTTLRYGDGGTEIPEDGNVLTEADKEFYNGMENCTVSMVYKYNEFESKKAYALFTLVGKNTTEENGANHYLTVWHIPTGLDYQGKNAGQISYSYDGRSAYWTRDFYATNNHNYHKVTFSINSGAANQLRIIIDGQNNNDRSYTLVNNEYADGLTQVSNILSCLANFEVEQVLVGKAVEGSVAYTNKALDDLNGTVQYVKVDKAKYVNLDEIQTVHDKRYDDEDAGVIAKFQILKAECAALNQSDYTSESWTASGIEAANTAAAAVDADTAKEWTLYDQIEALTNAKNALVLDAQPESITSAALTLTAPVKGETPAATAVVAEDANYSAGNVTWKAGEEVFTGEAFAASTVYTASIDLTAKEGYAFADDATATVNGQDATVTKTDAGVTVAYTFPETEAEETPVPEALKDALAAAAAIKANGKTYTADTQKALDDAVAAAEALTAEASDKEIQDAADAIMTAIDNLIEELPTFVEYTGTITATADSEEKEKEKAPSGPATAAVDGNTASFWHSNYSGVNEAKYNETGLTGNNNLYIHLEAASSVAGVSYVPRIDENDARTANGSITKANIYVRKEGESDDTWTLVAENVTWSYDNWKYTTDGAKKATFKAVDNVTDVRIEAINTQGASVPQNNHFINAAEVKILAPGVPNTDEREKITAPNITLTAPTAENGFVDAASDNYVPAKVEDGAEAPAELTSSAKVVADGDIQALDGVVIADQSKEANAKFNITDKEKFLIKFKMKIDSTKLNNSDTFAVIGKMDEQYGVQIASDKTKNKTYLELYAKAETITEGEGSDAWPSQKVTLNTGENGDLDKWQDVIAMYDGNAFSLYVGGKRETAKTTDRGNSGFTLGENTGNSFAIGKNTQANKGSVKTFPGLIADVVMYKGDQVPAETAFVEETKEGDAVVTRTVDAEKLATALADKKAMFNLKITPASGQEPKYDLKTAWTDAEGNVPSAYEKGVDYTATMTLTAHEGYKFTSVTSFPVVKVGETQVAPEVAIADDAQAGTSVMTVSYTFEAPAKDKAEVAFAAALAEAKAYTNESDYTAESWKALQDAVKAAEELDTTDMTAEQIQAEVTKLQAAIEGLEKNDNVIELTPDVTVTKPVVGQAVPSGLATLTGSSLATDATLILDEKAEIDPKTGAIKGRITDANPKDPNSPFNVTGKEKMVLRLDIKCEKPTENGKYAIVGKMNDQYGIQLQKSGSKIDILFYACFPVEKWAQVTYTIPADWDWDAWHEVVGYYDGFEDGVTPPLHLYVDGHHPTEDRKVTGQLANYSEAIFTIGYNAAPKEEGQILPAGEDFSDCNGCINNIRLYTKDNVPELNITSDMDAATVESTLNDALKDAVSSFVLKGTSVDQGDYYEVTETTWDPAEGTVDQYKDYAVTVKLAAKDNYIFADDATVKLRTDAANELEGAEVKVSEDGRTMTISYTFKGEEHPRDLLKAYLPTVKDMENVENGVRVYTKASWANFEEKRTAAQEAAANDTLKPEDYEAALTALKGAVTKLIHAASHCECTLGDIKDFDDIAKDLVTGEELKITLKGAVESHEADCMVPEHADKTPTVAYAFDGSHSGAELTGSELKITKAGTYKVKITVTLGEATKDKTITVTVTSKASEAEKQALQDAIADAEKYDKAQYTADSWAKVEEALNAAKELDPNTATAAAVNAAKDAIQEAVAGLKLQADADKEVLYDTLGKLIDDAQAKTASKLYTVESANALTAVCNEAIKVYNKAIDDQKIVHLENVTAEELDKAIKDLQAGIDKLVTKEAQNAADLQEAQTTVTTTLSDAKKLVDAGKGTYTDASWKAFTEAYAAAQKAAASKDAVAIKKAAAALAAAQKALVKGADAPKPGQNIDMKDGRYQIISVDKKTVRLVKAKAKKSAKMGVAGSISINGVKYTVVEVGAKAFKGIKTLKQITLSKNIKTIGKQAFAGCKKLSKVVVKSTVLKTIKSGAFKGTSKKMTVIFKSKKVKAKTRKALLKKMKKAGMSKSAKLK